MPLPGLGLMARLHDGAVAPRVASSAAQLRQPHCALTGPRLRQVRCAAKVTPSDPDEDPTLTAIVQAAAANAQRPGEGVSLPPPSASAVHIEQSTLSASDLGASMNDGLLHTAAPPATDTETSTRDNGAAAADGNGNGSQKGGKKKSGKSKRRKILRSHASNDPIIMITRPLPRVLLVHTGGTLGMDPTASFETDGEGHVHVRRGTGGHYPGSLQPGNMLMNIKAVVPELAAFANLDLKVAFNRDSCRVGPKEWLQLATLLHKNRDYYDAFMIVHGTDTMAYTASAISLMLSGFKKPIVMTGSQLPLMMPRSDARQNLIDSITCATAAFTPPHVHMQEVAVCFGGRLMRGNRSRKTDSSVYQAFDSPNYPHLAALGVDVDWNHSALLRVTGPYRPRLKLNPNVIRIPIIPGSDPRTLYGDLHGRGVRGIVLEAFGVGNMPDLASQGWMPWLKQQTKKGLQVYLGSQCANGNLQPELYRAGSVAMAMGVEGGPQMTPECASVKMMLCLEYPDIPLSVPLAGEL
ncbi:unnamed protein product [Pedinophyceae sp. YPF-701]|nr:unnamed protein product [Pedinophyceae sp. YPF-701]